MAVTLRLQRLGNKKRPFYRIVAADQQKPRDGSFLEIVGTYNSLTEPPTIVLKEDRVKARLNSGAKISDTVAKIVKSQLPGFLEDLTSARLAKIQATRKARKQRQAKAKK